MGATRTHTHAHRRVPRRVAPLGLWPRYAAPTPCNLKTPPLGPLESAGADSPAQWLKVI